MDYQMATMPQEMIKTIEADNSHTDAVQAIGPEQAKKFTAILMRYKTGKSRTEQRIQTSENWWKLRNSAEEQKTTRIGGDMGFTSVSGWLHNVIVSKHADAMESFPEPNILPREAGDRGEAQMLSSIIPCVLEQNEFEEVYSEAMWQKLKTGTGVYKVVWDSSKLHGLGDIVVGPVNLLNIYWEPGVTDIQKSRYFFHVELYDKDALEQQYPEQLQGKLNGKTFANAQFLYDDHVDNTDKHTVIEVYYHKYVSGRQTLQYCKYVEDIVLFATENDPDLAERGLYDHGKYPYVFDALYPIEGSPCGYGYVDICRNPQTEIDMLKTSIIKNAMVGATPRYFARQDGAVNEQEFLDLNRAIVHVNGNLGEDALRQITVDPLDAIYVNVLDRSIQELRETSGNTETSTGNIQSGVTAASAIAALQEASGKGSRDSTQTAYRAYARIVDFCIELIRQFYDLPRQFRILGQYGVEQYVSYSNAGIQMQDQGNDFGQDMGARLPVFDIKVSAQKKSVYTKVSQNELALQLFQLGFFNPQLTDQALMCMDMMDFDGKDATMQKIARNGTLQDKLIQYMQLALAYAQMADPAQAELIAQDIMVTMGGSGAVASSSASTQMLRADNLEGLGKQEPSHVAKARSRSNEAAQPEDGEVTARGRRS